MPQKMQAASLRFGTTLTMRPVSRPSSASQAATLVRRAVEVAEEKVEKDKLDPGKLFPPKARPVSAVPVGLSGAGCTSTPYPARTRPQSAAATKLASQGFAAAVTAAERRTEHRPDRPTSSPGHSYHIGRLVGRGRVAHMAAAAQARNQSPPKRALSAGHSAPILRPARPEAAELPFHGGLDARGRPSSEKFEGGKCVFEEIIRTDEFFGSMLKEIKASYNSSQQVLAFSEASAAEIAVDAIRRPWIEDATDTNECDTARANGSPEVPQKVRQLEQENLALRELLRRCHGQLKRRPASSSSPLPVKMAAPTLSVWASPEPLAAKMRRPAPDRPSSVPALNLSEIDDESDYDEGEEEEDDYYEDYILHNAETFAA